MESRKPGRPRKQKAVIDRIEAGAWAVLLVGHKQVEKVIPVEQLPKGARAGTWLKVRIHENAVQDIAVDAEETEVARGRIASKMDRLRGRQSSLKPISAAEIQDGSNRLQNPLPSDSKPAEQSPVAPAPLALRPSAEEDRSKPEPQDEWIDEADAGADAHHDE
jgi:hypothetical protein